MITPTLAASPIRAAAEFRVRPGPALLSGDLDDASLAAHRAQFGELPEVSLAGLITTTEAIGLRGRGGGAFAFARKLRTVAEGRRRPVVVVNAAEGEPASAKDSALVRCAPHLILDGAVVAARALRTREMHVIVPGERPLTEHAMLAALAERSEHFVVHRTSGGFVGGQSRAVLELMAGRENLPVTAWQPEAVRGHRGRPTLLSNAETFAQVGWLALRGVDVYQRLGTRCEPGTTLLTVTDADGTHVCEVPYGERLPFAPGSGPVLLGGFHGSWVEPARLAALSVSVSGLAAAGTPLGAGVVISPQRCPVDFTAEVVAYLSDQRAGRCGPCDRGLPSLSQAMQRLAGGVPGAGEEAARLCGLVAGRGACAHPDGTVRLVGSLLRNLPGEVAAHESGTCAAAHRGWQP